MVRKNMFANAIGIGNDRLSSNCLYSGISATPECRTVMQRKMQTNIELKIRLFDSLSLSLSLSLSRDMTYTDFFMSQSVCI